MIGDEAWITSALAELVSTPSLSGQEAAAQEIVLKLMREAGAYDVRIVRVDAAKLRERYGFSTPTATDGMFALVGSWGDPTGAPFTVLNGHVDTVPATVGWEIDPYDTRITDGWMNGLGSADMKAGVVGAIAAVARAKAAGTLKGHVEIQSVPDEEDGGGTGTLACVDELLERGRIPDFAIVCEPTRVEIATAQVGSRAMHFSFRGVQSHANMKQAGVSAVEAAIDLATGLRAWSEMAHRRVHPLLGLTSVNIGKMRGGIGATSVAPDCDMEVCFTYHQNDEQIIIAEIDAIIDEWRSNKHPKIEMSFRELHNVQPFDTAADLSAVRALALALGRDDIDPRGFPAGSDGRLISRLLKCPTVIFGPGDFSRIHKINEAVEIAEIVLHAEALERFLSCNFGTDQST